MIKNDALYFYGNLNFYKWTVPIIFISIIDPKKIKIAEIKIDTRILTDKVQIENVRLFFLSIHGMCRFVYHQKC
jgi:hypothetical protein